MPFVLPKPSGAAGMSMYSTSAWTMRFGLDMSASTSRRGSGTLATPMLGCEEPFRNDAVSAWPRVTALKMVVLPESGRPNIPMAKDADLAGEGNALLPGAYSILSQPIR